MSESDWVVCMGCGHDVTSERVCSRCTKAGSICDLDELQPGDFTSAAGYEVHQRQQAMLAACECRFLPREIRNAKDDRIAELEARIAEYDNG